MLRPKDKIYTRDQLVKQVKQWKSENATIVFTNGCFDIVHLGHVDYLEKARREGDKLIVGLNTDASVRKLKGATRPIINEESRMRVIASLMFVDAVTLFDEETPFELISAIMPDVLIKGNDYSPSNIVGADIVLGNGGKVSTIELVSGYSTSSIVEKIISSDSK